ncbi:hypothetical protein N7449_004798 [Penicillium cf. viridicatum]|uniref:Nucleoside phosphorylase domain-containing protein n=1 Tax=Penicillium cf. viridicatum TaxID=2972119 RepID=A0A9W9MK29_9EURO|nr:hypothetical protein N7449_004798 [Penicillium cf. viridicatum]
MIVTFISTKDSFLVGIGGGIAPEVRAGDVVVSTPVSQFPRVVGWPNNPISRLLTPLSSLETEHKLIGSKMPEYL